jgi:D-glycero-D-manno-heptose 1,7-bisphosphate phosphatase
VSLKPGAFLDRDGVLNGVTILNGIPHPPRNVSEVGIIQGVPEALHELIKLGFVPIVVTNQPDVARGITTQTEVDQINRHIADLTGIEHFYSCTHDDVDHCVCRKPKPGLIFKAALDLGISLSESIMVGDRWKDIAAGQEAGCECFFIENNYEEMAPKPPFTKVSSLLGMAEFLRGQRGV